MAFILCRDETSEFISSKIVMNFRSMIKFSLCGPLLPQGFIIPFIVHQQLKVREFTSGICSFIHRTIFDEAMIENFGYDIVAFILCCDLMWVCLFSIIMKWF